MSVVDKSHYPESQVYWLSIDHHISRIVVKYCRNIFSRKCICCIRDEQASFTNSSASDKNALKYVIGRDAICVPSVEHSHPKHLSLAHDSLCN